MTQKDVLARVRMLLQKHKNEINETGKQMLCRAEFALMQDIVEEGK